MSDQAAFRRGLAEPVVAFFEHVQKNSAGKGKDDGRVWHVAWVEILELKEHQLKDDRCLEILALISASIERLRAQVRSSSRLTDDNKEMIRQVLDGLKLCLSPSALGAAVGRYRQHFTPDRLGQIRLLATFLNNETPPGEITSGAVSELNACVDEIEKLLGEDEMGRFARELLGPHMQMIRWMLQHLNWFSTDTVTEEWVKAGLDARKVVPPESTARTDGDCAAEFWRQYGKFARVIDEGQLWNLNLPPDRWRKRIHLTDEP